MQLQTCISAQLAVSNKAIIDQMMAMNNSMQSMQSMMQSMNDNLAAINVKLGLQPPQPLVPLPPLQSFAPVQIQQATPITQHSIPPAPQAKKEEVKETRLYQATVEDDAESIAESATGSKSHDSKQLFRKWAPHTGFLTTFLATSLTSSFGCSLSSSFGCSLASFSAFQLNYIRCMEEMEATGEG